MNKILQEVLEKKIQDILSKKSDVKQLTQSFSNLQNSNSFAFGIIVGRIYNSFFYQSKRILNREPTNKEFEEFLDFLNSRKSELENLW